MKIEDVHAHLARRMPEFQPSGPPQALTGGNLNHVWRVNGRDGSSLVVKHAPPYIASAPHIPLDASRIAFEARALVFLGTQGLLQRVCSDEVRPPRLLDADLEAATLVLEDVGEGPDLSQALAQAPMRRLGRFIGMLHVQTAGDATIAAAFDNQAVEKARFDVQYAAVGDLATRANLSNAAELGEKARALGFKLLARGSCLTMGDLWPRSILVRGANLRVLDWEFVHYGVPAQDLGHLAAHLSLFGALGHAAWAEFARGYIELAGKPGPESLADARLHLGCELLMRTVGPFRAGYVFDGISDADPAFIAALKRVEASLTGPENLEELLRDTPS
jgi:hypothetical protein